MCRQNAACENLCFEQKQGGKSRNTITELAVDHAGQLMEEDCRATVPAHDDIRVMGTCAMRTSMGKPKCLWKGTFPNAVLLTQVSQGLLVSMARRQRLTLPEL
jgi:hypothetical protein